MFLCFKNHFNRIFIVLFLILPGCQLQEPTKNHGIVFLKNRSDQLIINKTNKNDVVKIIGQPHSKSINNDDIWIYVERTLSKGKYHKLGQHVLKKNNTNKIAFSKEETKNELTKRSFVESFLSSMKQKMYGNRK